MLPSHPMQVMEKERKRREAAARVDAKLALSEKHQVRSHGLQLHYHRIFPMANPYCSCKLNTEWCWPHQMQEQLEKREAEFEEVWREREVSAHHAVHAADADWQPPRRPSSPRILASPCSKCGLSAATTAVIASDSEFLPNSQGALRDRKMAFVKHQLSRVERLKAEKSNVHDRIVRPLHDVMASSNGRPLHDVMTCSNGRPLRASRCARELVS